MITSSSSPSLPFCKHLPSGSGHTDVPDVTLCTRKTACEAGKEEQQIDYERRKAQAQAQFALERADCERLKATERVGCEINQQWLNATQNMGLTTSRVQLISELQMERLQ